MTAVIAEMSWGQVALLVWGTVALLAWPRLFLDLRAAPPKTRAGWDAIVAGVIAATWPLLFPLRLVSKFVGQ